MRLIQVHATHLCDFTRFYVEDDIKLSVKDCLPLFLKVVLPTSQMWMFTNNKDKYKYK